MNNNENYTADNPVNESSQDRFQRYNFSKRIAQTIIDRKSKESIVLGLYGAWGEGKSSVLNFINNELEKSDSVISIHFNPWRYSDEESLLVNFFQRIAGALDKKLETKVERAASFIKKYGSVLKFSNMIEIDATDIGGDAKIETFKERVDEFLSDTTQRLVVFVDDIDRLDKNEIYTLFRIVKLTADFSNTVYILSFDEKMVAAAIGERFGEGDKKAGENFLEKIIQVPIHIPKAQPEALKRFCFELLNNAFASNEIDLTQDEVNRFIRRFTTSVLTRLDTPRLAVRYSNTISFSLPLLQGEVNVVDLMLIEALKVFYPAHYAFVKENSDFFIGSYISTSTYSNEKNEKKDSFLARLNELDLNLERDQISDVRELLSDLFPKIESVLENRSYSVDRHDKWREEKRITSKDYFDRYFSYTVIEGDISDVQFDSFLSELDSMNDGDVLKAVQDIVDNASVTKFIDKLQSKEKDLSWEKSKKVAIVIARLSSSLDANGSLFSFRMDSSLKQAVVFIYRQLEKNRKEADLFSLCKGIIERAATLQFAIEMSDWFNYGESPDEKLLTTKQFKEIYQQICFKALSNLEEGEDIFSKYADDGRTLLQMWAIGDKKGLRKYIAEYFKNDGDVVKFLFVFASTIHSSAYPQPYKGDLTQGAFEGIRQVASINTVETTLKKRFKKSELQKERPTLDSRRNGPNSEINIARQFFHWLDLSKTGDTAVTVNADS